MNDFVFEPVSSLWEMTLSKLRPGSMLPAVRFISLLEQEDDQGAEDAALDLEQRGIMLDVSQLPKFETNAATTSRIAREEKLYRENALIENLEENDPLRLTLEQISDISPVEEGEELIRRSQSGDNDAAQVLTSGYLPFVVECAGEFLGKGVLLMDLIQEGSLGLWQAVLNYQSGSFREHAGWWIRQAMARAVTLQARANGVGQNLSRDMDRYQKADQELLLRLGRNASDEEIALEMGINPEKAASLRKLLREIQTMEQVRKAGEQKEPEPDDEQAVEDTAYFQSRQRISELLSCVAEQDAKILTMRFGLDGKLPMTDVEVGEKLGLTAEQVRQREAAALASLRQGEKAESGQ